MRPTALALVVLVACGAESREKPAALDAPDAGRVPEPADASSGQAMTSDAASAQQDSGQVASDSGAIEAGAQDARDSGAEEPACSGPDADGDLVPDECDTCPGMSDEDIDENGYADACDRVLWAMSFPEKQRTPPIENPQAGLQLKRGDDVWVHAMAPLSGEPSEHQDLVVTFEAGDGSRIPATFEDLIAALTRPFNNQLVQGAVLTEWSGKSSFNTSEESPFDGPVTIRRVVVRGYARPDGAIAASWSVRGFVTPP